MCREAAALKAALRQNEALLRGLDAAHEVADVATAEAQVRLMFGSVLTSAWDHVRAGA